ncbi:MAG TPA: glycosyltransferase family 4 protein [Candidimonas sp.]|nr:glycosyltransferase family 4 protein [Candidimonas sp.]
MKVESVGRMEAGPSAERRLRILTWHVHGNYLYSLTRAPHDFIIPVMEDGRPGYSPLGNKIPWGANVREVPASEIRNEVVDCVVYQSRTAFDVDGRDLLTPAQRDLPCAYIEHNPPEPHPTDTPHFFHHHNGVLVHVTAYNAMMWHAPNIRTTVIEHGVPAMPGLTATCTLGRGITVINHLRSRGRRVGADIYAQAQRRVALDLIGMESESMPGGLGEVSNMDVPAFLANYRFFFTPVRYASLGLSVVEAMMVGLPVVGMATTELPSVIDNGVTGFVDTRWDRVEACMHALIADRDLALEWGRAARRVALERFAMDRYLRDWMRLYSQLCGARREQSIAGD